MPTKWYESEVVSIKKLSPDTKEFVVKIPGEEIFFFVPGQFVTMDLPVGEKRQQRWRSYSIANAPDQKNHLEFCIVRFEDGLGSCYFHDVVKVGDIIRFKGPDGGFVLPEKNDSPLLLISTGTGIAPFRSMIRHLCNQTAQVSNLYLIVGARKKEDLLYFDEMNDMQQTMPNFQYIPTLSRESWAGRTGYVHPIYKELAAGKPDAQFFLCGWKNMIDEAKQNLLDIGYDKKQIHLELYG